MNKSKTISIAIDASRCRSGGAREHIINILKCFDPTFHNIRYLHIWAYNDLLGCLPEGLFIVKHRSLFLELSLPFQFFWQMCILPFQVHKYNCDILLTLDAASLNFFSKQVVISRDLLSYEPSIANMYGFGSQRLRIEVIKFVQNFHFRNSTSSIFLSDYARDLILASCGKITKSIIVAHGYDKAYFGVNRNWVSVPAPSITISKFLYISNSAPYKHQIEVVKAIGVLRDKGYEIELRLVGGGQGEYQKKLVKQIEAVNKKGICIQQTCFVGKTELLAFYKNYDVFIFASSCEAFGITLLEAMSTGIPIICSNRSSLPGLLRDGGLYFDPSNINELADTITKYINSATLRKEKSHRALELAKEYSWGKCSKETFRFVESSIFT